MVEDKIALALKDIARIKEELRGVKKDMKTEEIIEDDQYIELKSAYKDLKMQIKSIEDDAAEELKKDDFYNKLRELRMKKEEDLAKANKSLFDAVSQLPVKPVQLKMETDFGSVSIQIHPEMRVFVNGKEEKKRA